MTGNVILVPSALRQPSHTASLSEKSAPSVTVRRLITGVTATGSGWEAVTVRRTAPLAPSVSVSRSWDRASLTCESLSTTCKRSAISLPL